MGLPRSAVDRKRRQKQAPNAEPSKWASAEGIALGSAIGNTAWVGVSELISVLPKVIGGMAVGAVGVWAAWKSYADKRREQRGFRGD